MATGAQYTGARSRASRNDVGGVSPQDNLRELIDLAREISAEAEAIDAVILGVEALLQSQKRLMEEQGVENSLYDNELWTGVAVLLNIARQKAVAFGEKSQTIEKTGRQAIQPAVA